MDEARLELIRLAGGDPFDVVRRESESHQQEHGCGLFPAGPAVMQLASTFVRAASPRLVLDLGCGFGYSTFWLAHATGDGTRVIGVDSDVEHVEHARAASVRLGVASRVEFVVGEVADVLERFDEPVDVIHDDAWFAATPSHLDRMLHLLRGGAVLTMPNWFLLVDALTGQPRNDWERFAGPTWASDVLAYAKVLSERPDLDICWTLDPPLGVAVKRR